MITISEINESIEKIKLSMKIFSDYCINHGPKYTDYVSYKANQFSTALELYKYMTENHIDKIEKSYCYIYDLNSEFITMDFDDVIKQNGHVYDYTYTFIVLDKKSPLFMSKVNVSMCPNRYDSNNIDITFNDMNHILLCFFDLFGERNKNGKFNNSYDTAIRRFIEDTIKDEDGILKKEKEFNEKGLVL